MLYGAEIPTLYITDCSDTAGRSATVMTVPEMNRPVPGSPFGPCGPMAPVSPLSPLSPLSPFGPGSPSKAPASASAFTCLAICSAFAEACCTCSAQLGVGMAGSISEGVVPSSMRPTTAQIVGITFVPSPSLPYTPIRSMSPDSVKTSHGTSQALSVIRTSRSVPLPWKTAVADRPSQSSESRNVTGIPTAPDVTGDSGIASAFLLFTVTRIIRITSLS